MCPDRPHQQFAVGYRERRLCLVITSFYVKCLCCDKIMVLSDFLNETRRRWLKAFKLFKGGKSRKSHRNRVSPALTHSPSYNGTVDASSEIDLQRFSVSCRTSLPPMHISSDIYESSYHSSLNSYDSSHHSLRGSCTDSAYDSARSTPVHKTPVSYATVTYFNVNDSEDSSSIKTEYTILECEEDSMRDEDERTQNIINESIELVSTL